ncbi:hypothetical protein LMJ53_15525 [Rheinheimera sp. UJ51]|uniref:hypothetical protein n=1 Tax=Rheinheimera sp. UJ51 TaxID=2892446 RepID=UPI001E5736C7|nr:hypothetical protein [Rheinheimera sp. UJ51]MCC5453130.1 hypothetical protein [Rheinheimera sp. UJ51]
MSQTRCYDEAELIVMFKAYSKYCDIKVLIPDYVEEEFYHYLETNKSFKKGFVQNLEYHYFYLIKTD